ncbi:hypothetical protein N7470_007054 [Penicillium chermesinum]|nr:hypothetical protein N7470_007054 [Penicillium chermesinum]
MSWTQKGEYWVRPLDTFEKACYIIGQRGKDVGHEHWLVMVTAKIENCSKDEIIPAFQKAWKALRLQCPDIAVDIEGYEKRYTPIRSAQDLELWCNGTFHVEPACSADGFFTHETGLMGSKVHCHWFPASQEISLVSPHWRWDLRGATSMLHKLLSEIESPSLFPPVYAGEEYQRLPYSMQDITNASISSSTNQEGALAEQAYQWFAHPQVDGPGIGLAPINPHANPGNTRIAEVILSKDLTNEVCLSARRLGITVTTAVHASMISETTRMNPSSAKTHHTSASLPFNVDAHAHWRELTEKIQPFYRSSWDPTETNMIAAYQLTMEHVGENISQAWGRADEPEPALSSIGIIEGAFLNRFYGPVTIQDVSYCVSNSYSSIAHYCYTWGGKLRLRACFNEAFYKDDYVQNWLFSLRRNLLQNLGVQRSLCVDH